MEKRTTLPYITAVLIWGGLWGIFEATAGYLLHLLPVSIGWMIWYPAACFFTLNVYRKTRRADAMLAVGMLSASIKLLNLLLPGRIDRVINPAVSIVLEALALTAAILVCKRFLRGRRSVISEKGIIILCINTLWRLLYILYIQFLVPGWMREVSVISSGEKLIEFLLIHNLLSCLVLFACSLCIKPVLRGIKELERRLILLPPLSGRAAGGLRLTGAAFVLACAVVLELLI